MVDENFDGTVSILMIGPFPPPKGGARVLFKHFVNELKSKEKVNIGVLETWKPGDSAVSKLLTSILLFGRVLVSGHGYDIVTFWASDRGAIFFGPALSFLCSLLGTPFILRKFGGGFDITYESSSGIKRYPLNYLLKSASLTLLETEYLVEKFKELVPGANVAWHPNARPVNVACKAKNVGCSKFIFLGKVKKKKGVEEIVAAADRFPEDEINVNIYGPMEDSVSKISFQHYNNVSYGGVVDSEKVPDLLNNHHVLLLPTYYEGEGYPGVILEAYSAGIPVIATDWRSIPEIVDESSGVLVEPRNVEELYRAMKKVHEDQKYYEELSKGAWEKKEEFSLEKWTNEFLKYCRDITGK